MNPYDFFILPAIGCLIGYFANLLFVAMLFRPYKELKFGKLRIPFTPGIIPKNLNKLSSSTCNGIKEALLSSGKLEKILLSPRVKSELIHSVLSGTFQKADEMTFAELLSCVNAEGYYTRLKENAAGYLTDRIILVASDMDFAAILAKEKQNTKTKGAAGLFASMLSSSSFPFLLHGIERAIKGYITKNGDSIIKPLIVAEIDKITAQNISETILGLGLSQETVRKIMEEAYEKAIKDHLKNIVCAVDLSLFIKSKSCSANFAFIEAHVRSALKSELRLFTAIGAVVGAAIGLLSVLL